MTTPTLRGHTVYLRGISNNVANVINQNTAATLQRSNGYTIGAGRKQVPSYDPPVEGFAQIQALDSVDLKQLDGLNIQGTLRAAYLRGALHGVVRPDQQGGDLLTVNGQAWLVVKVLESWPNWTKVAICLQLP